MMGRRDGTVHRVALGGVAPSGPRFGNLADLADSRENGRGIDTLRPT